MKKTIKNQIILKDGKSYFSIPIINPPSNISLNKFFDFRNSPGFIVKNNKIEKWYLTGLTNKDGITYIYGPKFEGNSLEEFLKLPLEKSLSYLEKLIATLIIIKNQLNKSLLIQLDNIYFLKNDSILFLPQNVLEMVKDLDKKYDFKKYSLINNPYLNKIEEKTSYNILILLYRLITKKFPFEGNTEEDIYSKIRNLNIIPPKIQNPEINEGISDYIVSLFNKDKYKTLSLIEWQKYINKIKNEKIINKISKEEKKERIKEYKRQKEILDKKYQKNIFWEQNKRKIIIISLSVIISSIILFSFLKTVLRPRVIKGFSPKQVVEAYYLSMNKLDHLTMSDCVINNAGKTDINEVMILYIMQKQSLAYENRSNVIFADEWDKKGRPPIKPPLFVFGVLNLVIKEESSNSEEVMFVATYEKWSNYIDEQETDEKRVKYRGSNIKDRMFLKKYKKYWIIYKLDRIENITIPE